MSFEDDSTEIMRETSALTPKTKLKTNIGTALIVAGFLVSATLWCANVSAELATIRKDIAELTKKMDQLYEPVHAQINDPNVQAKN